MQSLLVELECPYLWIEGNYQNHDVFLRLLPDEPDQIESGEICEDWGNPRLTGQ